MSFLVTASLLNSWEWYLNSWDDGEDAALADLVKTLKREPIEDNQAMREGRAFEDAVTDYCTNGVEPSNDSYGDCVREVAEYVRGKIFQYKASKLVTVDGVDFLLYGRMDAFGGPWIDDIKYGHSYEAGKYYDNPQLKMYLELEPGPIGMRFIYSDGSGVYLDEYRRESVRSIVPTVREFWDWLNGFPEYLETYKREWVSKY